MVTGISREARRWPVLIHGAEADYKSYGQQVQGEIGGSNIPRGWRQIDPKNSARGFTVASGFSGSPVLDDSGNLVWGMVVAIAAKGSGVAYAIPAENLWAALQSAGAETTVRLPDAADPQAAAAMAKLRAEYEAQLAERESETGGCSRNSISSGRPFAGSGRRHRDDQLQHGSELPGHCSGLAASLTGDRQLLFDLVAQGLGGRKDVACGQRVERGRDSAGVLKAFRHPLSGKI